MWLDSHCHVTADRFDEDREIGIGCIQPKADRLGISAEHVVTVARKEIQNSVAGKQGQRHETDYRAFEQPLTDEEDDYGPDKKR